MSNLGGYNWDLISTSGISLWKTGFLGARSGTGNFLVTESKAESECSVVVKETSVIFTWAKFTVKLRI